MADDHESIHGSIDDHVSIPIAPIDDHGSMPIDNHGSIPIDDHGSIDDHVSIPITPIDDHGSMPIGNHGSIPIDDHVSIPITPIDDHGSMPIDDHGSIDDVGSIASSFDVSPPMPDNRMSSDDDGSSDSDDDGSSDSDDHGTIDDDHDSIPIEDQEIWRQRRDRLRALKSVHGTQRQEEFRCQEEFRFRVYPLLHAIKEGHVDKFIDALENFLTAEKVALSNVVAIRSPSRNTLLHVAAGIANADILRALLYVIPGTRLANRANKRGDTALHVAVRAGWISTARLLLKRGSDVDKANEAGNTALHEAVKKRLYDLTDLLLQRSSISVNKMNREGKCPLYLAVETGNSEILLLLLRAVDGNEVLLSEIEGMSPVHGAVMHRSSVMLKKMSEWKIELFDLRSDGENTPLHLAAHENYVKGVEFLVKKFASSAFKRNREGYLPIHIACKMGHLETINVLHRHWPDWLEPEELLTLKEQQNILHVAAKYGRASVVKYILGDPKLKKLINAKDREGNTPLHVATKQWQPEVLLSLTRDNRVNLELVNHENFTALNIVDKTLIEFDAPLHQSLTRTILVSAGTPRSKDKAISESSGLDPWIMRQPPPLPRLKDQANTRMLVATLVATVTFAAGFAVPGGFKGSEPDAGIATLLSKPMFDVFVICNSIAMYNSIIAVVILLWTHINDSHAALRVLRMARIPLLIALATMSVAFMAGVYVTISKSTWIAVVVLIVGIAALFVILILYITLFIPLGYKYRLVQLFADYIIRAAILISRWPTEGASEENVFANVGMALCETRRRS